MDAGRRTELATLGPGCFWCVDEVFRELLEVFFTVHDPTTLNRQGGDVGRSTAPWSSITRPSSGRWRSR